MRPIVDGRAGDARPPESGVVPSATSCLRVLGIMGVLALPSTLPAVAAQPGFSPLLSDEERRYLADHGPIRFAYTRGIEPFTIVDEAGVVRGINRDMLRLLSVELGVEFTTVERANITEALQAVTNGSADLTAPVAHSPERAVLFGLTQPYFRGASSLWAKEGARFPTDMEGTTVGVVRGSAISQTIATTWPAASFVGFDDIASALVAVREGRVDAAVGAEAPTSYIALVNGYFDVVPVGEPFDVRPIGFVVAKDNELLRSIIDKGLARISREERAAISLRWTGLDLTERPPAEPVVSLRMVVIGGLVLVAVATAVIVPVWIVTLRRSVDARTREIRMLNQDLEQFAYVASHDLKEPLRMVSSFVGLLREKYQGRLDETADQYIHYAVDGANRMQALVDGLLEFSRVGLRRADFRPVDLEAVLADVRANLVVAFAEKQARLDVGPMPRVLGDRQLITQLLQNLIANALKFHKPGEPPVIRVDAKRDGDAWVVSVADNGIGIEGEQQGELFTLFRRLHTRDEYPGNGIGLAVSRRIVQQHGGQIWVESTPGEGATFRFTLGRATT